MTLSTSTRLLAAIVALALAAGSLLLLLPSPEPDRAPGSAEPQAPSAPQFSTVRPAPNGLAVARRFGSIWAHAINGRLSDAQWRSGRRLVEREELLEAIAPPDQPNEPADGSSAGDVSTLQFTTTSAQPDQVVVVASCTDSAGDPQQLEVTVALTRRGWRVASLHDPGYDLSTTTPYQRDA